MSEIIEIVDVDFAKSGDLQVIKDDPALHPAGTPAVYHVIVGGVTRHPNATAEDVIRALGHYIQGLSGMVK